MRTDTILVTVDDSYFYALVRETYPRARSMAFWWEYVGRHLYGAPSLDEVESVSIQNQG